MPSRLKDAASPYLEEAAEQPADWYLWDEEAFQRARQEDKPILVDSGAVWCHWCHVMDHESYADPELAELINERFVPVKLDRDERPEIDGRLQRAVAAKLDAPVRGEAKVPETVGSEGPVALEPGS